MIKTPCIIFAGGKSSRMGEDKALLPFGGFDTLAHYQLSRLQKIFTDVYISSRDIDKFNFEANIIQDIKTDGIFAPTAGFVAIYEKLKDKSFFIISVDAPFIGEKEIDKLFEADTKDADATIPKTPKNIQPMCGIYHRSLEPKFKEMLKTDNHKLGYLLKSSNTTYVDFEDEQPFFNLNHPSEYKQALREIESFINSK